MAKPVILVAGANGQLGNEIRELAANSPEFSFVYTDREELLIQKADDVDKLFEATRPAYCINCAAYTAVDKAESDQETAYEVNAAGAGNLADASKKYGARFIHVSTDYVFDGESPEPYKEDANTNPMNVYGASKLKGEQLTLQNNTDAIIIRTAWVYSEFGNNFVKTMLRLMTERPELNVVNDQVGSPTYAADLAGCIMHIISGDRAGNLQWKPGIYHYSNQGRISWFDFAVAIKELGKKDCKVNPIPGAEFKTPAKRPSFSLLDTSKIRSTFQCEIPEWKTSLQRCMERLPA